MCSKYEHIEPMGVIYYYYYNHHHHYLHYLLYPVMNKEKYYT